MPASRREFLAAVGATSMTLPLGFGTFLDRGDAAPKTKKAVKLGMVAGKMTLQEKFDLLKKIGFDGVEVGRPSSLDRAELKDVSQKTKLPIHGVVNSAHWSKPLSHPSAKVRKEGVDALNSAIDDAAYLGASSVLLVPGIVSADVSYGDCYRRSQEEIRRVLPKAEELKIDILFENVWNNFLLSPLEAARYVDEFESKAIGFYFDVGNIVRYGWPHHWVESLGARIKKLDIKDYSRKKQNDEGIWKGFQVGIGDGDAGWKRVMAALEKVGYEGWATAEVGGGDEKRLIDIKARMDRVLSGR